MHNYKCDYCGCFLDPGEKCDCQEASERLRKKYEQLTAVTKDGQIILGGIERELHTG
jgi:hypothetical protein